MIDQFLSRSLYTTSAHSPTCFDLFSGAGGLSVGFAMAGGRPVGAVDFDADSIDTYKRNFPLANDVACCPIESWRPTTKRGQVDVIIGGPPCQGFSLARGTRFVDDPRNQLYKYFVRLVEVYKPKWLVMENVEGITNIGNGVILAQILEDFSRIGYGLEYRVVNMATYGVPQLRRRAIFVGNRLGVNFKWPVSAFYDPRKIRPTSDLFERALLPFNAVNAALGDLILPEGNYFAHRANAQMRGPRNRCAHTEPAFTLRVRGDEFALCERPAKSAFIPGDAPSEEVLYREPQNSLQYFLSICRPSWADVEKQKLVRKKRSLPKLLGTRRLTIREQARLQTFPDWFEFQGRTTSKARQIGNAVPPLFGYQLFSQIFKFL
jgi:DNA (cytosine-5)-methyltransferase 1